jgi:AraC-like DNA-binding protein
VDARAQQAREHHHKAAASLSDADQHRQQRDALVRALRAEDPQQWSYAALARAVGCSRELIRLILRDI